MLQDTVLSAKSLPIFPIDYQSIADSSINGELLRRTSPLTEGIDYIALPEWFVKKYLVDIQCCCLQKDFPFNHKIIQRTSFRSIHVVFRQYHGFD